MLHWDNSVNWVSTLLQLSSGAPAEGCLAPGWRQSNSTDGLCAPGDGARERNLSELDNHIVLSQLSEPRESSGPVFPESKIIKLDLGFLHPHLSI